MTRLTSKSSLLTWAMGLIVGVGGVGHLADTASAKEPIAAPAEFGSIPSPKMVQKTRQPRNQDLLALVEEAIEISGRRYLIANEHSPWQIYHGLNAFRRDFKLELNGQLVSAVDWLSTTNPQFRESPWFEKTVHGGRAHRYTVPYHFEGHPNQSLALMVMCNLPLDHQFAVDDGTITVADIVNNAKVTLNPREEQTWTLWFLTHYLDSDETWMTRYGETWSIERLVQDQIQTQVTKAACGGTHNLYALAAARNNHLRNGGSLRGVWMQADYKLKRYMVAARSLQRRDGSFPTMYFRGYGNPKTFSEQIASSGHMMEWLMVAADDKQIDDEWIERGIRYIAQKLVDHRDESAECGPLYHAVSALMLYRDRAQGTPWPNPEEQSETPLAQPNTDLAMQPLPAVTPQGVQGGMFPSTEEAPAPAEPAELKVERTAELPKIQPLQSGNVEEDSEKEEAADEELPSVSDQAAEGKLSIGLDADTEMELEFEMPSERVAEQVEILDAPEDAPQVR
ncbi:hypothetical protein [Rubinisphaera brasiliensis]|nr:hypothetical protein [Rubinisphaera brasiliensis]